MRVLDVDTRLRLLQDRFEGLKYTSSPSSEEVCEFRGHATSLLELSKIDVRGHLAEVLVVCYFAALVLIYWFTGHATLSSCLAGKKQEADDGDVNREDERLVFLFAMRNEKPVKEEAGDCP
nr:hypothetical protein Iba_chr07aCG8590 [Ipomoea batatas]